MRIAISLVFLATILSLIGCEKDNSKNLQTYSAVKAWHEAVRNKDLAAYRKSLTPMAIEFPDEHFKSDLEDESVQKNHAIDEVILRNEKIVHNDKSNIDAAQVEWKGADGKWHFISLIKLNKWEFNEWKFNGFLN